MKKSSERKKNREMNKKEIEDAQSLVRGAEDIIKEVPIKEEIEVPKINEHEISQFVEEPTISYSAEEEERAAETRRETPLEETVEEEHRELTPEQREAAEGQYNLFRQEFNGQKTEDLYASVKDIYQRVQGGGEFTSEDMDKVNAARYVAQKREEEIGKGQYGRPSETVSQQLVVTERMGEWLSRKYRH